MKILLVNNHTQHLDYLNKALAGHDVEMVMYEPGVEFNCQDKDLVILSGGGGEGLEINDEHHGKLWYQDQMEFILNCDKPILGICMGFEVIARAFGAKVEPFGQLIMGFRKLTTTAKGQKLLGRPSLRQYEAHEWHIADIDQEQFDVLATSTSGLELIKHKHRPIMATQFHPEKGGSLKLAQLLSLT